MIFFLMIVYREKKEDAEIDWKNEEQHLNKQQKNKYKASSLPLLNYAEEINLVRNNLFG